MRISCAKDSVNTNKLTIQSKASWISRRLFCALLFCFSIRSWNHKNFNVVGNYVFQCKVHKFIDVFGNSNGTICALTSSSGTGGEVK